MKKVLPIRRMPVSLIFFKLLQNQHPTISDFGSRRDEIKKILRSIANILDALNTIRNHASMAHPNEQILDDHEAMLSINITKTFIQYLDKKIKCRKINPIDEPVESIDRNFKRLSFYCDSLFLFLNIYNRQLSTGEASLWFLSRSAWAIDR